LVQTTVSGFRADLAIAARPIDPLLVRVMAATPAGAAMLHTTVAPTVLGVPRRRTSCRNRPAACRSLRFA